MASNNDPSNIPYDPLPLTNNEHPSNSLYNTPPSPEPRSSFNTPHMSTTELGLDVDDHAIPMGATQPRFLGAAFYSGSGSPSVRESFTSSNHTFPSEYNSSVYALNDTPRYRDDPRDSYYAGDQGAVPLSSLPSRNLLEKRNIYAAPKSKSRRQFVLVASALSLLIVALAIVIPLYFLVLKPNKKLNSTGTNHSPSATTSAAVPSATSVTGRDGTLITMEDGTTFTYTNQFGGYWYWDKNDPFNQGAKAQSWTPALNETFNFGVDKIRGVNFGGWLNTEPFITPALYQKYLNNSVPAVDEWTLCQAMAADSAGGGLNQLETHYQTFITEQDFADVAGAGLNFIRIPIGYWAIEVREGEPFLPKVSWKYFLKAIQWARKYGLRINLDLHALPGSQNGWNHSGRLGNVGFLNGPMGYANAQRSLDYIRIIAEFISQPQYKDVVPIFGIMNEPQSSLMGGQDPLSRFYMQAYNIIRTAGGTGQGNGPFVSFHDGFLARSSWANFIPNADRISIDTHPYMCFSSQSSAPMSSYATTPCTTWGSIVNNSMSAFGLTTAGEFSNAVTDCGLFLNGVGLGTRYEGTYPGNWPAVGSCATWTNWQNFNNATKSAIRQFALASMDALQDYFFWTWKIGNSSISGTVETPHWSYKLGLDNDWMPTDPREAIGVCGYSDIWNPPLLSWQTGGAGAGNIPSSASSTLAWPPASINNGGALSILPSYTPIGTVPTLPVPTFTATASINAGNGWSNNGDTQGLFVNIPTCSYLDPWVNPTVSAPSPLCSGAARRDSVSPPLITLLPSSLF